MSTRTKVHANVALTAASSCRIIHFGEKLPDVNFLPKKRIQSRYSNKFFIRIQRRASVAQPPSQSKVKLIEQAIHMQACRRNGSDVNNVTHTPLSRSLLARLYETSALNSRSKCINKCCSTSRWVSIYTPNLSFSAACQAFPIFWQKEGQRRKKKQTKKPKPCHSNFIFLHPDGYRSTINL